MALTIVYNQILWNLDMVASLGTNQTFYVNESKLYIENRIFQSFIRNGEERNQILSAIENTWALTDELLNSYQHSVLLQPHVYYDEIKPNDFENIINQLNEFKDKEENVTNGLKRLGTFNRYQIDSSFLNRIGRIISEYKRLCNRANLLLQHHEKLSIIKK
jgi:hypothetical protein